jgi:hypothetical protein
MLAAARIIDKENPYINKNRAKANSEKPSSCKKDPGAESTRINIF